MDSRLIFLPSCTFLKSDGVWESGKLLDSWEDSFFPSGRADFLEKLVGLKVQDPYRKPTQVGGCDCTKVNG